MNIVTKIVRILPAVFVCLTIFGLLMNFREWSSIPLVFAILFHMANGEGNKKILALYLLRASVYLVVFCFLFSVLAYSAFTDGPIHKPGFIFFIVVFFFIGIQVFEFMRAMDNAEGAVKMVIMFVSSLLSLVFFGLLIIQVFDR